jgi:hypothetical protein
MKKQVGKNIKILRYLCLITIVSLGMLTIVGTGGGGSDGDDCTTTSLITTTTTTTQITTSPQILPETTLLLGDWYFYYWIISMWDDYYYLTDISDDINSQGAYFVIGVNEYGNYINACYWPDDGNWALFEPGTIIDKFYFFYTDGDTILNNSCYYQISHPTEEWSRCYDLYGYKFGLASSLNNDTWGQLEKSEDEIIDDEELRAAEIDKAELIDDTIKDKYYQLKQLVDSLE